MRRLTVYMKHSAFEVALDDDIAHELIKVLDMCVDGEYDHPVKIKSSLSGFPTVWKFRGSEVIGYKEIEHKSFMEMQVRSVHQETPGGE